LRAIRLEAHVQIIQEKDRLKIKFKR
jgi:hypothetical protein